MKKFIVICGLINACAILIGELVNNFEKPKDLYSLFYPTENITGDTLVNLEYLSWGGGFRNVATVYEGNLMKIKFKKIRLDVYPDSGLDSIPVWYFKKSGNIIYRRTKEYPSPFNFWFGLNLWLGTISLIYLLPLLIYYLKLRKK